MYPSGLSHIGCPSFVVVGLSTFSQTHMSSASAIRMSFTSTKGFPHAWENEDTTENRKNNEQDAVLLPVVLVK